MVNIKEFHEPLEIEHGGNVYTVDTDKHYQSGPPSPPPSQPSVLTQRIRQRTSAHPEENLVRSGVLESGTKPRHFSSLHLNFLNHESMYVCNKFKRKECMKYRRMGLSMQTHIPLPTEVTLEYSFLEFSTVMQTYTQNYF